MTASIPTAATASRTEPVTLPGLIAAQAERHPDRPAVDIEGQQITYARLWAGVRRRAERVRARGVVAGDRVLIVHDDVVQVLVTMLGTSLAGGIYIPVDPDTPPARLMQLIDRFSPGLVVTGSTEVAAAVGAPVWLLDEPAVGLEGDADPGGPDPVYLDPDDPTVILITSGSTGLPKGVMISHRNILAFARWCVGEFRLGPEDRVANQNSLSFIMSTLDLYATFLAGGCLVPVPIAQRRDPAALAALLTTAGVTVWYCVPSVMQMMMRYTPMLAGDPPAALRLLLFAGEPFPVASLRRLLSWYPGQAYNLYGSTEANVCAYYPIDRAEIEHLAAVPIGRPCGFARFRIDPVTPGSEVGELLVTGDTLFHGYWGEPLRTGPFPMRDLVDRSNPDRLMCLGRVDNVMKVRGSRVGAELEQVCSSVSGVDSCVSFVMGEGMDQALVVVAEISPGSAVTSLDVRAAVADGLPRHFMPDRILLASTLPRNARGKIDRMAVRAAYGTGRATA